MSAFPPPNPAGRQEFDAPADSKPSPSRPSRWWWLLLLGVPAIAAVALIAAIAGAGDDDDDADAPADTVVATSIAVGDTTEAPEVSVSVTATSEAPAASTDAPTTPPPTAAPATTAAPDTTEPPTTTAATPTVPPTTSLPPTTVLPGLVITDVVVSPGKEDGEPVGGATSLVPGEAPVFPSWTNRVCLFWKVTGMPDGVSNGVLWTHEGEVVQSLEDTELPWTLPSNSEAVWCVPATPTGIESGAHRVEYFVAGISQFAADFVIQR